MTTLTDTDIDQRFEELETQFRDHQPTTEQTRALAQRLGQEIRIATARDGITKVVTAWQPLISRLADIEVPAGTAVSCDGGEIRYRSRNSPGGFWAACPECGLPLLRCGQDGCTLRDPCPDCADADTCFMCTDWCRDGTRMCGECDWCELRNNPTLQQLHRDRRRLVQENRYASMQYDQHNGSHSGTGHGQRGRGNGRASRKQRTRDRIAADIIDTLNRSVDGLTLATIKKAVTGGNSTIYEVLQQLVADGDIIRDGDIYRTGPDSPGPS